MMKICFGYFETQNMNREGEQKTHTHTQAASLIPLSARYFKKSALKTKVDQIRSIKDTFFDRFPSKNNFLSKRCMRRVFQSCYNQVQQKDYIALNAIANCYWIKWSYLIKVECTEKFMFNFGPTHILQHGNSKGLNEYTSFQKQTIHCLLLSHIASIL